MTRSGTPYAVAYLLIAILLWSIGAPTPLVILAAWWSGANAGWQVCRRSAALRDEMAGETA